jgi:hypothetical protein
MPKFLFSTHSAMRQERTPNPERPLTEVEWLDDKALYCLLDTAHRTGVTLKELLSYIVKEWYGISCDVTAPHLRWEIAQSKRRAS